eukprot:4064024-Pyramimonas_sp.AAC.1
MPQEPEARAASYLLVRVGTPLRRPPRRPSRAGGMSSAACEGVDVKGLCQLTCSKELPLKASVNSPARRS